MSAETPLRFAEPDSPQWVDAWQQLIAAHGDPEAEDATTGERWQYMGTARIGGQWVHEFRHRAFIPRPLRSCGGTPRRCYERFAMRAPVPADWLAERYHDTAEGIRSALSGVHA